MPELTFRNAEEKDVPLILEFIKKLADYEHRLDEVIATEEALKYWIFDKNQAEVIFALEDGKEIGFAFFFLSFSTYIANVNMHLEDLFIDPEYRGKGYGCNGLLLLCETAKANGIRELYDDIAIDNSSVALFLKCGFVEVLRTTEYVLVKKEL